MKKRISLIIFLLIIMLATNVFAATKSADTTMSIVEDNVCTIQLDENASFEKRMIGYDLTRHEVTIQLDIKNYSEKIIPSGEMMLVIDSSSSMDEIVEGTKSRKDLVLQSANKLVENLLKANPTSLKIGVVTFSTGTEKDDNGYLIAGTEKDAQKVCDFTNDAKTLTSKISAIEGTGPYTNLDSGLKLAQKQFSDDKSNKYVIVLTDGLPNLAVGYNDLVSYEGETAVITETKNTLKSLKNTNVITMLTGISDEEATFRTDGTNTYTYGQVIEEVFGTEENPTIGKFYKISDNEIEKTITNEIYNDLLPINNELKDITVVDYFPQYIVDNFEMTYVEGTDIKNVSSAIDTETNSITWKLSKVSPGEEVKIQYVLKTKDEIDEKILDQVLDTNQKIEINYKDFDEKTQTKLSEVTPKIKLTKVPEKPVTPEEPKDTTIAPEPIPKAGTPFIMIGIIGMLSVTIFFGIKSRKIK